MWVKTLAKFCRKVYIKSVERQKLISSSFSPLSYIIQEVVNSVCYFLNFKRGVSIKQLILELPSFLLRSESLVGHKGWSKEILKTVLCIKKIMI